MKHDPTVSLTAMFVQMQKTILQMTERIEALERALCAAQEREAPTLTEAQQAMQRERQTMAMICEQVATEYGVKLSDIRGRRRIAVLNEIRGEACRRMLDRGFSSPRIGRYLCDRHHTTVLHLAGRLGKEGAVQQ